jgi:hypothetical protein
MLHGMKDIAAKWIEAMRGHIRLLKRPWVLPVGVLALIAAHLTILRYALQHAALSAAVVSGVIIVVVIKHLGLLGSLFAMFRRRSRH